MHRNMQYTKNGDFYDCHVVPGVGNDCPWDLVLVLQNYVECWERQGDGSIIIFQSPNRTVRASPGMVLCIPQNDANDVLSFTYPDFQLLFREARDKLGEYWIVEGLVTDPAVYPQLNGVEAWSGVVEWQFSHGPPDLRGGSENFLHLEDGLKELSPAIFHWVDK